MALVPLASQGNFLHIYDFHVDPDHIGVIGGSAGGRAPAPKSLRLSVGTPGCIGTRETTP